MREYCFDKFEVFFRSMFILSLVCMRELIKERNKNRKILCTTRFVYISFVSSSFSSYLFLIPSSSAFAFNGSFPCCRAKNQKNLQQNSSNFCGNIFVSIVFVCFIMAPKQFSWNEKKQISAPWMEVKRRNYFRWKIKRLSFFPFIHFNSSCYSHFYQPIRFFPVHKNLHRHFKYGQFSVQKKTGIHHFLVIMTEIMRWIIWFWLLYRLTSINLMVKMKPIIIRIT